MTTRVQPGGLNFSAAAILLTVGAVLHAQTPAAVPVPTPDTTPISKLPTPQQPARARSIATPTIITPPALPLMPTPQGLEMDRVVAIVNNDLILDSDVDQERRFAALLPYGEASGTYSRDEAIQRLINRDLILQQAHLQPQDQITTEAAGKDLSALRRELPRCKEFQCETKEGWDRYLATQGFTEDSLTELWRQRMQVLDFIEQRFRMGMRITPEEIAAYYNKTLLPQYAAQHAPPAPLSVVSARIQQVLLEQQVSKLLDDWLQNLRAEGNVVVLHPGEVAP